MKINIDELQKVTIFLLSKLKENSGEEIEISNDYYWSILDDELYNPYEKPTDLTLGQLSDDLEEIKRLINSDDAIMYDLKRLAVIFKAISIENKTAFWYYNPTNVFSVHNNDGSIDTYNSIKELNAAKIKNVDYHRKSDLGFVGNFKFAYNGWVNATGETARAKETMYAYIGGVGSFLAPAIASELLVVRGVNVINVMPEGRLANHLFKGSGKLADTSANRALIQRLANTKSLGVDQYGKSWYMGVDSSGRSIYTYAQGGVVKGAGYATMTAEQMIIRYGLK